MCLYRAKQLGIKLGSKLGSKVGSKVGSKLGSYIHYFSVIRCLDAFCTAGFPSAMFPNV